MLLPITSPTAAAELLERAYEHCARLKLLKPTHQAAVFAAVLSVKREAARLAQTPTTN